MELSFRDILTAQEQRFSKFRMTNGGDNVRVSGSLRSGHAVNIKTVTEAFVSGGGPPPVPITIEGPIGVAAMRGGLLLVTLYLSQDVAYVNCDGSSFVFCTIPGSFPGGVERYITIAPSGIFVTQGEDIYVCTAGIANLFTTITGAGTDHVGITFDTSGLFGGNLIVTSESGKIWTVDLFGTATLLADLGLAEIESPMIAPASFGTYANQILVADGTNGQVHAIDNLGNITLDVFDWNGAESIAAIPDTGFGTRCSNDAYYVALTNLNLVQAYSASEFSGMSGIFITSEFGAGIANISWNGSSYDINFFDNIPNALMEGSCFVQ